MSLAGAVPPQFSGLSADQALTLLGGLGDVWRCGETGLAGEFDGIRYRTDAHVLYGVVDVDETEFGVGPQALQLATADAYRRIFALLDAQGYPQLWRVWNYLSDINIDTHGLERYRQFNIGRADAFRAAHRQAIGNVPAACALGTTEGPLTIAFLAGKSLPIPLENPRQISAYNYPAAYGPQSPTFSRGAFVHLPGQELLFVSGTASIVGHQTLHVGDVEGQTRETLANIAALLEAAQAKSRTQPYRLAELRMRAYLRHAVDLPRVRAVVDAVIGPAAAIDYVRADVCRADLLVEIEALASHPMGNC